MRTFAWMQDLGRSTGGKIISLLLALAMIFSYSNIFVYSAKAFAAESDTTNEQSEGEGSGDGNSQGNEPENQNEGSDTQNGTSGTETNNEGTTGGTEIKTEPSNNNEDGQDENTTEGDQSQEPVAPYVFDEATSTLTITGVDEVTSADVVAYKQIAKNIVINKVATIKKGTFDEFKMESLEINNVDHIEYSFRSCNNLLSLKVKNVGTIDMFAFFGPQKLETLEMDGVQKIGDRIFGYEGNAPSLTTVSLSNLSTGQYMFQGAKGITSLTLNNIGTIGFQSFMNCTSITDLDLNGKVKEIQNSAFLGCTSLTNINIDNIKLGNTVFQGCTGIQSATISNINTLNSVLLFNGCTSLNNVSLHDINMLGSKEVLNLNMFQNCGNNISLTLTNVGYIGLYAFTSSAAIKELKLNNVDVVGQYAFSSCKKLQTVNMEGIRVIDVGAFWYCTNLKTVDSLSNVSERVNGFAFFGCENLEGLSIADLTKMGFIGSNDEIMERVKAILAGTFKLDDAENIKELELEDSWTSGAIGKSENWNQYDNGTQVMQQARWEDSDTVVAEVKVDATYTGEKQMDYIFVADLSASMAYFGNTNDQNARFYDMQSKLLDMTGQLLDTRGYNCNVAIVTFGGKNGNKATHDNSGFLSNKDEAITYINGLKPLNENTDYGLGLQEAQKLAQENKAKGRNTVVVFLSDGAPNANSSGDQDGTKAAEEIRNMDVPIYGVLHSPTSGQHDKALNVMKQVCGEGNVSEAFDTESFGKAMNAAFSQVYGTNVVTIPVNAVDFDLDESTIEVSAGEVSYENGIITWTIKDMPFAQHTLSYKLALKDDNANRVGTYTYSINNGSNVSFNNQGGAAAGIDLTLSRTVETPTPDPTPVPAPATPTTPAAPAAPVAPAAPAALAAPAGPAAADATPIADNPLPLAGPTEENISDDETPMASVYDEPHCWAHYLIIIGMIITAIYGAAVAIRRSSNNRNMGELERDLTEEREISYSSSHARNHA